MSLNQPKAKQRTLRLLTLYSRCKACKCIDNPCAYILLPPHIFLPLYKYHRMNIDAKKTQAIQALSNTKDEDLIEEVYGLLYPAQSISDIEINKLPQPLQQKINKALEDYQSGNYITHAQMKEKLQQWLTK